MKAKGYFAGQVELCERGSRTGPVQLKVGVAHQTETEKIAQSETKTVVIIKHKCNHMDKDMNQWLFTNIFRKKL